MTDIIKETINKRIVFLGDNKTGKTSLITAFAEANPSTAEPKVTFVSEPPASEPEKSKKDSKKNDDSESDSEDSSKEDPVLAAEIDALLTHSSIKHEEQPYELAMWDAATDEEFKKKREIVYAKADVIVLVFAFDSLKSFKNISKKWKPHLKKNLTKNKKCPIVLVGNKLDLKVKVEEGEESDEDDESKGVSSESGQKIAKKIGAIKFYECSAKTKEGVDQLFKNLAHGTDLQSANKSKCLIS